MSRKMTDNEIYRIIKDNIHDYDSGHQLAKDFGIPLNRFYRMYNVYKKNHPNEQLNTHVSEYLNTEPKKVFNVIKSLINSGEVKSVHEACQKLGINDASLFWVLKKNGFNGIKDFYKRYILNKADSKKASSKPIKEKKTVTKYDHDEVITKIKEAIASQEAKSVKAAAKLLDIPDSTVTNIVISKYGSFEKLYEEIKQEKLDEIYDKLVELFKSKEADSLYTARLLLKISNKTAMEAIRSKGFNTLDEFYNQFSEPSTEENVLDKLEKVIKEHGRITEVEAARLLGITDRTLRKKLSKNGLTYKDFVDSVISSDEKLTEKVIKEEIKKDKEVSKLKFERDMYKNKYLELLKTATPVDEIIEHIKDDIKRLDNVDLSLVEYNDSHEFNSEEELILLLSDTHIGEVVQLDNIIVDNQTETINNYNIEIFKERMQRLYEGIIKITDRLESKKKYTRFNIFMLGDMVSGIIHEELLRHKGLAITDQVVMGAEIIADFIYKLKHKFPVIDIYCVVGNHGRLDKKVSFKDKWNSFDYLLYKFIETKLENVEGINFYIPKQSMIIVEKFGYYFLLRHGDGKSNSFAGIPVYGIMRTSAKATQMFAGLHNTYIHYEVLGHYHTPMALPKPAGKIIINGTMKGTDEYGLSSFLSSDVSQKLLVLNSKHGIFANIDIYCE